VVSKQLLRSGTAIGALVREAEHAESKADFVHKMSIALKEANETEYWIDLLGATDYLKEEEFQSVKNDTHELLNSLLQYLSLQKEAQMKKWWQILIEVWDIVIAIHCEGTTRYGVGLLYFDFFL